MAHGQLAEHAADHAVQVAAAGQVGQQGLVLRPHRVPVGPVHVRGIEVVAIDPPGLAEDLRPTRRGARSRTEIAAIELSAPSPLLNLPASTIPADLAGAVEELLVVGGEDEAVDALGQGLAPRGS